MRIIVNAHKCEIDKTPVNEKEINITKCEFEFIDEMSDDFVKEAYFTLNGSTYKQIIVDNECDIPYEVLKEKGTVEIGVVAYVIENGEEIIRYNPSPVYFNTWIGSLKENYENSKPITPTDKEQIESIVNNAVNEINKALEDVEMAVQEAINLDLDVSKEGKVATITLTKKDASTKKVTLSDGTSLMFNWDGTKLGIKTDEDEEYTYVDLQGIQGPVGPQGEAFKIKKTYATIDLMIADYDNMEINDYVMISGSVEDEDNAKMFVKTETEDPTYKWQYLGDFSGATGIRGETGLTPNIQIGTVSSGDVPNVTRTGTNENPVLNFTLVKGDKGDVGNTGEKGATGNGIASITKTSSEGLVDTYTITFTDGTKTTFEVTNGEDGETPLSEFNALKTRVEDLESNQLFNEETGTEIYIDDAHDTTVDEFSLSKESTQHTTTGVQLFDVSAIEINKTWYGTNNGSRARFYIEYTPNEDYTISIINLPTEIESVAVIEASSLTSSTDNIYSQNIISLNTFTHNFSSEATYLVLQFSANTTLTREIANKIKIMLQSGTISTEWEEYTGGEASPNPDYPQEVKTVKGYSNLLENTATSKTINGITFTINNDKSVTANGTATANANLLINNFTFIGGKTYFLNGSPEGGGTDTYRIQVVLNGNVSGISDTGLGVKKTYDVDTTMSIQISVRANMTVNNLVFKPMIVEGTEEHPYVPYGNNYIDIKLVGKNLFDKDNEYLINGYLNAYGKYIVAGATTKSTYMKCEKNTTYTISKTLSSRFAVAESINVPANNIDISNRIVNHTATHITYTTSSTAEYLIIYFYDSSVDTLTPEEIFDTIQIEKGSTATDYEAYKETIVPIPLNGNEIAGKETYLDVYKIDIDGNCLLNKVFNKIDSYNGEEITTDYISTTGGLDEGATVYYVRDNPDTIDLNYQVDLRLFKGINNITNSEEGNMKIRYVRDTQMYLDNLEDRMKALEGTAL